MVGQKVSRQLVGVKEWWGNVPLDDLVSQLLKAFVYVADIDILSPSLFAFSRGLFGSHC